MNTYTHLRERKFTFYECVNFARFYSDNRDTKSAHELMLDFLKIKKNFTAPTIAMKIVQLIEQSVADYYNIPLDDIRGKRRFADLIRARQVIAYLSVKYGSQHLVAKALPGINRMKIQHSKTMCAILMETEPDLAHEVESISNSIAGQIVSLERSSPEENDEPAAEQTPDNFPNN